jgi:hypothetical protein
MLVKVVQMQCKTFLVIDLYSYDFIKLHFTFKFIFRNLFCNCHNKSLIFIVRCKLVIVYFLCSLGLEKNLKTEHLFMLESSLTFSIYSFTHMKIPLKIMKSRRHLLKGTVKSSNFVRGH